MQVFRANGFGERWVLATPRDAYFYAMPPMAPATLRDVMAFVSVADCMALSDFLGVRNDRLTLIRAVEDHLKWGSLLLMKETRPRLKLDPRKEPPPPPYEPIPDNDPIVDDPRALRILRCDPRLGDQPLRFTYMIRGLAGKPAKLRITDAKGQLVHERPLESGETIDGSYERSFDGRVDPGSHTLAGRHLTTEYGPCRLEIRHDDKFKDDAPFTIAEPDFQVEYADLHFATDRALLLPLPEDETHYEDSPRATPLQVIAALLEFAADHPEREVAVYGHADTAGSDAHNDELSRERARNVELLLRGDRAGWAAHCQQHYEIADFKRVHRWAAERFAWSCDPGPLDNEWTSTAKQARAEFRRRCDELLGTSLAQGVKQNEADWSAIFDLYEIAVAGYLECKPEHLPALRSAIAFAEPTLIACGEHWPALGQGQDGVAERLNRRVEVMFFEPGELPRAHGAEQPQGDELYASGRYQHIQLTPIGSDEALLRIFLLSEDGEPMCGADFSAHTRAGLWSGTSDDQGAVTVPRALVDIEFDIEWSFGGGSIQRRRHTVDSEAKSEAAVIRRLTNLGFEHPRGLERSIIMFEHFLGLPATGKISSIANYVNHWFSTGKVPEPDASSETVPPAPNDQHIASPRDNDW